MVKSEKVAELRRLLATTEFRGLSKGVCAARLVMTGRASQQEAASACKVDRNVVRKAIRATKAKRPVGANGRPPTLDTEEASELRQELLARAAAKEPMTNSDMREKVRPLSCLLPHSESLKSAHTSFLSGTGNHGCPS